jgi:hypothetical protein
MYADQSFSLYSKRKKRTGITHTDEGFSQPDNIYTTVFDKRIVHHPWLWWFMIDLYVALLHEEGFDMGLKDIAL